MAHQNLRSWETRLGVRLDALDHAEPPELAEIQRRLLAREDSLDETLLPLCEQLLPLLNIKSGRELSELVLRRWPRSALAASLRAAEMGVEEQRPVSAGLRRAGVTHDDLRRRDWWVVRAFAGRAQGFFDDGVVRVGFSSLTDLRSLPASRADIAADFAAHHPEPIPGRVSMSATQLYRFAHEIEIGDVVVTPVARNRSVSAGLIDGPYDWDERPPDFKHFRRAVWLRHRISRDRLSATTHEELSQRPTVFPLYRGRSDLAGAL